MSRFSGLSAAELFGLAPVGVTLEQAKLAFRGDPSLPKSRFDHTSLAIVTPRLSLATWLGRRAARRTVPILNLFNRTPTPVEEGWSVRVTEVRDFRGAALTYDSHNGTDFVIPPGTTVVASAPGRVVARRQEFNRGGLKLYVDHGRGLMTTYHHLGRTLVDVGAEVARGQPIALSAYSGIDGFLLFPWVAPHVHYNVVLGGVLVDPFGAPGEGSLWRVENDPRPFVGSALERPEPTAFAPERVQALLDDLVDAERRAELQAIPDVTRRGFELIIEAVTYPTRFRTKEAGRMLYPEVPPREPRLDLPFSSTDFDGAAFADDLGFR